MATTPTKRPEDYITEGKVVIMFKPIGGGAKALKQKKFKLDASALFQAVIDFLRKQLRSPPSEPLFLYVGSAFQPHPEEIVSDLFKCFHSSGQLVVEYSIVPAWG